MKLIIMSIIGSMLIGYFIGCINVSYLFSKIKGMDIRKYGSGNAGASNMVILFGKRAGLITALIDIFKAVIAVNIAGYVFANAVYGEMNYARIIAGVFTIVGHIAPFYMGFKGGKGLASLGGTILALDYKYFIFFLALAVIIAVVTDYICFVPVSIVILFPAVYGYAHHSWLPMIIFVIPIIMVWYRHMENFHRIRLGKELRFHFLWNRESEASRFGMEDNGEDIFENEIDSVDKVVK